MVAELISARIIGAGFVLTFISLTFLALVWITIRIYLRQKTEESLINETKEEIADAVKVVFINRTLPVAKRCGKLPKDEPEGTLTEAYETVISGLSGERYDAITTHFGSAERWIKNRIRIEYWNLPKTVEIELDGRSQKSAGEETAESSVSETEAESICETTATTEEQSLSENDAEMIGNEEFETKSEETETAKTSKEETAPMLVEPARNSETKSDDASSSQTDSPETKTESSVLYEDASGCEINAVITDGKLAVTWRGVTDDVPQTTTMMLDETESFQFFSVLGCAGKNDRNKLKRVKGKYSAYKNGIYGEIKKTCERNGISFAEI